MGEEVRARVATLRQAPILQLRELKGPGEGEDASRDEPRALRERRHSVDHAVNDAVAHHVVDATPALSERPWLVAGGVLALAGAFQFSDLKDRCLSKCRHPGPYLLAHYRRGASGAFWLGFGHGVFCLGCCWALMLLMFAVGVAHVAWMAALAALMVYEKTGRHGHRVPRAAGVLLLVWGAVVLVHPGWLPDALSLAAPHHHGH